MRALAKLQKDSVPLICEVPFTNSSWPWRMRKWRSKPTSTIPSHPRQPSVLTIADTSTLPRIMACKVFLSYRGRFPYTPARRVLTGRRRWFCRSRPGRVCRVRAADRSSFRRVRRPRPTRLVQDSTPGTGGANAGRARIDGAGVQSRKSGRSQGRQIQDKETQHVAKFDLQNFTALVTAVGGLYNNYFCFFVRQAR